MIVDERDLLSNGLSDEFEFEVEILPSKHGIVVFLDIGFSTILLSLRYASQSIGQARNSKLYLPDLLLLLLQGNKELGQTRKPKEMVWQTSSGPSTLARSSEMPCRRCEKSLARSANCFRRDSLILGTVSCHSISSSGTHTVVFVHLLIENVLPLSLVVRSMHCLCPDDLE